MAELFIKCPKTGKDVPTGISVTPGTIFQGFNNTLKCPHCGETHTWDGKDAYLK